MGTSGGRRIQLLLVSQIDSTLKTEKRSVKNQCCYMSLKFHGKEILHHFCILLKSISTIRVSFSGDESDSRLLLNVHWKSIRRKRLET